MSLVLILSSSICWRVLLLIINNYQKKYRHKHYCIVNRLSLLRESMCLVSLLHCSLVSSGLWSQRWISGVSQGYLLYDLLLELYLWYFKNNLCPNHLMLLVYNLMSVLLVELLKYNKNGLLSVISYQVFQIIEFSAIPIVVINYFKTRLDWIKIKQERWVNSIFIWRLFSIIIFRLLYINYILGIVSNKLTLITIVPEVLAQTFLVYWCCNLTRAYYKYSSKLKK